MPCPSENFSTLFAAVYKRLLKESVRVVLFVWLVGFAFDSYFGLCRGFGALVFALDFLVWETFGREKNSKGKLLKGKVWLKKN
jgi:hypothetical protein